MTPYDPFFVPALWQLFLAMCRHERFVVLQPLLDGELCPPLNESKTCNVMPCAIEGIPFGGEEDEVKIDNMEEEIENTPTVVDQVSNECWWLWLRMTAHCS